jgi:hypothetical protein
MPGDRLDHGVVDMAGDGGSVDFSTVGRKHELSPTTPSDRDLQACSG